MSGAETAADGKLQADMDKHPKDYFVPNFGKDEDIISTQANIKNMEGKYKGKKASLAQHSKRDTPACSSANYGACANSETAADSKL